MKLEMFSPKHISELSLWNLTSQDLLFWANIKSPHERIDSLLKRWNNEDYIKAYFLVNNNELVGYGEIWYEPEEVEIARLLINPNLRSKGYGKKLVSLTLEEIKSKKMSDNIWLRVHPDNQLAFNLYKSSGFMRTNTIQEKVFNQDSDVNFHWMKYNNT